MQFKMKEAINSINAYVQKLAKDNIDTGVTLVAFDGTERINFEVVRDRITPSTWFPVSNDEIFARGSTPLNDAIGRIVTLARNGNYDKVALLIITDGEENTSNEITHQQAKDQLDLCRAKGWQVLFIGADFNNQEQAKSYGNRLIHSVFARTGNMVDTMSCTAAKRSDYAYSGVSMEYTEDERKKFSTESDKSKRG